MSYYPAGCMTGVQRRGGGGNVKRESTLASKYTDWFDFGFKIQFQLN